MAGLTPGLIPVNVDADHIGDGSLSDDGAGAIAGASSVAIQGVLGPELTTNGTFTGSATGWTLGAGWAYGSNAVTHTPGSTANISQASVVPVAEQYYQVVVIVSASSAGELVVSLGGATGGDPVQGSDGPNAYSFNIFTSDTSILTASPDTDFDGTITSISVKAMPEPFGVDTQDGTIGLHVDALGKVGIGTSAPTGELDISRSSTDHTVSIVFQNTATDSGDNRASVSISTYGGVGNTGKARFSFFTHKDDALENLASFHLDTDDVFNLQHTAGMVMDGPLVATDLTTQSVISAPSVATDGAGKLIAGAFLGNAIVTNSSPFTGQTVTSSTGKLDETLYITPAGTLLALTVELPAASNSRVGQIQRGFISQIITGLTVTVAGGGTIVGSTPVTSATNSTFAYQCSSVAGAGTWIRVQ